MKQINVKKLVLLNLPYVFLGLYASKLGQAWRLAAGADAREAVLRGAAPRRKYTVLCLAIYWVILWT